MHTTVQVSGHASGVMDDSMQWRVDTCTHRKTKAVLNQVISYPKV